MKKSAPMVAGLIVITTSLLTGCSSTSSPSPSLSSSSQVQTSTESATVQTPTTASKQATSSTPPTITAPTTSANTRVATCQTRNLSLTQGRVGVATGSTYVTYYLQNHGPSTCSSSMLGYPGFSLLSAGGSVIQHPAARNGTPYSLVQVRSGQRAQFVVRTVNGSIPGTGCSTSWKTAEVQVYPPNQTTPIRQSSTIAACDLSVSPVSAA
jgi:Protein of unknown function (DUF4232)